MKERIVVIGSEGTARNIIEQIADAIRRGSLDAEIAGVVVDTLRKGAMVAGFPVIAATGGIQELLGDRSLSFIYSLFKQDRMKERYDLLSGLKIPRERFTNFIHPLAYASESLTMGRGNVIMSCSAIQSNVTMGDFNIICTGVTVEHETALGSGNFIAANACIGSKVKMGNHCFIGLGSSVRESVTLEEVFVGMGAAVVEDFSNCRVKGVPAREF